MNKNVKRAKKRKLSVIGVSVVMMTTVPLFSINPAFAASQSAFSLVINNLPSTTSTTSPSSSSPSTLANQLVNSTISTTTPTISVSTDKTPDNTKITTIQPPSKQNIFTSVVNSSTTQGNVTGQVFNGSTLDTSINSVNLQDSFDNNAWSDPVQNGNFLGGTINYPQQRTSGTINAETQANVNNSPITLSSTNQDVLGTTPTPPPAITYSITYNGNGNTGGTVPTDANSYQTGQNATVLGNINNLTETGYTFAGWNTKADGSGTNYSVNSTIDISSNVTLYAMWTENQIITPPPITDYTVTYNGNGNTGGTEPPSGTAPSGTILGIVGQNTLVDNGYTFSGWNTAPDGSGTNYLAGSTLDLTANTTLYAQWTAIQPTITANFAWGQTSSNYSNLQQSNGIDYPTGTIDVQMTLESNNSPLSNANVTLSAQKGTTSVTNVTTDTNGNIDFQYTSPDSTTNTTDTITVTYGSKQFTFDVGIYLPQVTFEPITPATPLPNASIIPTNYVNGTVITGQVTYDSLPFTKDIQITTDPKYGYVGVVGLSQYFGHTNNISLNSNGDFIIGYVENSNYAKGNIYNMSSSAELADLISIQATTSISPTSADMITTEPNSASIPLIGGSMSMTNYDTTTDTASAGVVESVYGSVYQNNVPFANQTITMTSITESGSTLSAPVVTTLTTDANGNFTTNYTIPNSGDRFAIAMSVGNSTDYFASIYGTSQQTNSYSVSNVQVVPNSTNQDAIVTGTITKNGSALVNTTVDLSAGNGTVPTSITTNANGNFNFTYATTQTTGTVSDTVNIADGGSQIGAISISYTPNFITTSSAYFDYQDYNLTEDVIAFYALQTNASTPNTTFTVSSAFYGGTSFQTTTNSSGQLDFTIEYPYGNGYSYPDTFTITNNSTGYKYTVPITVSTLNTTIFNGYPVNLG